MKARATTLSALGLGALGAATRAQCGSSTTFTLVRGILKPCSLTTLGQVQGLQRAINDLSRVLSVRGVSIPTVSVDGDVGPQTVGAVQAIARELQAELSALGLGGLIADPGSIDATRIAANIVEIASAIAGVAGKIVDTSADPAEPRVQLDTTPDPSTAAPDTGDPPDQAPEKTEAEVRAAGFGGAGDNALVLAAILGTGLFLWVNQDSKKGKKKKKKGKKGKRCKGVRKDGTLKKGWRRKLGGGCPIRA